MMAGFGNKVLYSLPAFLADVLVELMAVLLLYGRAAFYPADVADLLIKT